MNDQRQNQNNQPAGPRFIMPAVAAQNHDLNPSVWALLCDVIFPAAKNPASIVMALDYCKARKLDVLKRPVHIVPMWSTRLSREVETIWPSIQELQTTASRTREWAGMDSPKWGPMLEQTFSGAKVTFPEWCEVTVYRYVGKQKCAFTVPVYWLEIYSTRGKSDLPTAMWLKRPRGQLHKCALAAALRAAFPEECGEYSADEMHGKELLDDAIEGSAVQVADEDASRKEASKPAASKPGDKPKPPPVGASVNPPANVQACNPDMIGQRVKNLAARLCERVLKSGEWKAAEDWARSNFVNEDLQYVLDELKKAKARAAQPDESVGQQAINQAKEKLAEPPQAAA